MLTLLVFSLTLFAAVLMSDLAHRSLLSTAVLFLGVGLAVGPAGLGVLHLELGDPLVKDLAVIALVAVLFSDGMRVRLSDLRRAWSLPARALLIGMPLTLGIVAVLAHLVTGLSWGDAFLLGAVLSPTDPVFASGILGRQEIPARLRRLLNVESGLNDGLAFPLVVVFLTLQGAGRHGLASLVADLVAGVAIGIGVPFVAARLERLRVFTVSVQHESIAAIAVILAVVSACELVGANEFLGAFAAGAMMASTRPDWHAAYRQVGEPVAEVLKLAAVLVFGVLLSSSILASVSWHGWLFVAAVLLVARPLAIHVAFVRSALPRTEVAIASWFGPKGFASLVFGLKVLEHGTPATTRIFALVAATVVASILAHGSTDVPIARWYSRHHTKAVDR